MQKSINFLDLEDTQARERSLQLAQSALITNAKAIQLIKSKIQPKHKKNFLSTFTPPLQCSKKARTLHLEGQIQQTENFERNRDTKFNSWASIGKNHFKSPKAGISRYFSNIVNQKQPTMKKIADQKQQQLNLWKYGSFYQKSQMPLAYVIQNYHQQGEKYEQKLRQLRELRKKIGLYYHYCQQREKIKNSTQNIKEKNSSTNKQLQFRKPFSKIAPEIFPKMRQYINLFSESENKKENQSHIWNEHFRTRNMKTLHDPHFIRRYYKQRDLFDKIQQMSQQANGVNQQEFKKAVIEDIKRNVQEDKHAILRIKMNHKKIIKIR